MEAEIRALLQENGVSFKTNSKSFIVGCPRCRKPDKLYIYRAGSRFTCFVCGELEGFRGKPEYALVELCGIPMKEIRDRLYGKSASAPTELFLTLEGFDFGNEDEEDYIEVEPALKQVDWPFDFYPLDHKFSEKGVKYLESRGIPLSVAMEYGIRYCPPKLSVAFPVQSQGVLYGWQTRLVEGDQPFWSDSMKKVVKPLKTITSKDFKKERALMFADRLNGSRHVVLTEGPFDSLKAHLCGGNVAAMGKAVSKFQIEILKNSGIEKVYMGLDPDAYLEIDRVRKEFYGFPVYDLRPPAPYKDLGEMPLEAVKYLFDNAPILHPTQVVIYLKNHFGA